MASPIDGPRRNTQQKEGGGADKGIKRGGGKKEGLEETGSGPSGDSFGARHCSPPGVGGGQGFRVMASLCARMGKRAQRRRPPAPGVEWGGGATCLDPRGVGIGAKDEPFASWVEGRPLGRNGRVIELGVGELGAWKKKPPLRRKEGRGWYRQQESNLYFTLRRHAFYPFNYGGFPRLGFGGQSPSEGVIVTAFVAERKDGAFPKQKKNVSQACER